MSYQGTRRSCPNFGRGGGALVSIRRYSAWVAIVAMGMLLGACAGPRHVVAGATAQEAAANRAQPYGDGLKALQTYQASGECATAAAGERIEDEAMDRSQLTRTPKSGESQNSPLSQFRPHGGRTGTTYGLRGERFRTGRDWRKARDRHTDLSFRYADAALHKNCLDRSDRVYRDLIHFYVGGTYSGIRDRARVGIDDVRARRQ